MQSVTLSLFRFGSVSARLWAFSQMATARFALRQIRDLQTFKLCGSGTGEGFTPITQHLRLRDSRHMARS